MQGRRRFRQHLGVKEGPLHHLNPVFTSEQLDTSESNSIASRDSHHARKDAHDADKSHSLPPTEGGSRPVKRRRFSAGQGDLIETSEGFIGQGPHHDRDASDHGPTISSEQPQVLHIPNPVDDNDQDSNVFSNEAVNNDEQCHVEVESMESHENGSTPADRAPNDSEHRNVDISGGQLGSSVHRNYEERVDSHESECSEVSQHLSLASWEHTIGRPKPKDC
ncbi:hypothetical protein FGB62_37g45 [Gracilaria domingensis]|nr:hypothetical protein FGB62_37g45 [Gracilaria domingensis]